MASENVLSSSGTQYSVSAATPATYDSVGFAALSFTDVGEVTNLGEFGANFNVVSYTSLATAVVVKRKGSKNNGSLNMTIGRDPTDAGQALLKSGADGANSALVYSHKVLFTDGSIQYFTGQIFSYNTTVGEADSIINASALVEIDNNIIEVAAP